MQMKDRSRGTLIGLAVGDALGAAVEFKSPGTFKPVTGFRSGGPHGLEPGEWTDDTSMALALADSIATVGWDLNDQADRYVQWWKKGKYSVKHQYLQRAREPRRAYRPLKGQLQPLQRQRKLCRASIYIRQRQFVLRFEGIVFWTQHDLGQHHAVL
jgi:ADP-ribosylglycohydrolase